MPANFLTKEKFEKKTKITKWLFWLAIGAGVFYFWGLIVPFVLLTITNTIYVIIASVVLIALVYALFIDKTLSTLAWYMYNSFMVTLTKMVVETRPVEIMKSYIKHLEKKHQEVLENMQILGGKIGEMKRLIANNDASIMDNAKMAESARKQGKSPVLYSNEVARLTKSNQRLAPVLGRMERIMDFTNKLGEATEFMIVDTRNEMEVQVKEYNAVKTSYSAMKAAQAILRGDKNKKNIFDDATKFIDEDMGRKIGEIDHFMLTSKSIFDKMDIEKGALEEDGLRIIEELINKDPARLMSGSTTHYVPTNNATPTKVAIERRSDNDEYSDMIKL